MTQIKLERIVPLETPDAEVCVDGVCEVPLPGGSPGISADRAEAATPS